jgi:hypothetical protein
MDGVRFCAMGLSRRCAQRRFTLEKVEDAEWARDAEGEKEASDNQKAEHVAERRESRVAKKQSCEERRHD